MKEVEIRTAEPIDTVEIASVLAESFAGYESLYTADAYAATTPKSNVIRDRFGKGEMWVAVLDEKVVGTVSVVPENESLYIRSMAILPTARGNEIGEQLLTKIEDYAVANGYRRLFLSTTPFLHRAISLYENFGFQTNDEPPHELYGTPLITMAKSLQVSND